MTNSPLLSMPFIATGATGPLYAQADVRPILPASLEAGAYAHWDLGGNSDSLIDLINGKALVPNLTAPTYNADSIQLADGGLNGLLTDLDDPLTLTACFVFRATHKGTGNNQILLNTGTTTSGDGGQLAWMTSNTDGSMSGNLQTRVAGNLTQSGFVSIANVATNPWIFVAISRDQTPVRRLFGTGYGIGQQTQDTPASAMVQSSPAKKLSIGSSYYTTAAYLYGANLAEVILFTSIKSFAELTAIAGRSKPRMQRKGIALLGL